MKKIIPVFCLLIVVLFSCSGDSNSILPTISYLLSENQMDRYGYKNDNTYLNENVVTYETSDGNKKVYVYSAPIENTGNAVSEDGSSYIASGSYSRKEFPKEWSQDNPIKITFASNYMELYPYNSNSYTATQMKNTNTFGQERESIVYGNAFGEGIDLICYPTSFGVNTEIIFRGKPSSNLLRLRVRLPSVMPDTTSEDYILLRNYVENNAVKSMIYTPLLVGNNSSWNFYSKIRFVDKDSIKDEYTLELALDEEFLNSSDTKYPVVSNQSFYLYKEKEPDTSTYSLSTADISYYLSPYLFLGRNTFRGEGWTYIRYEVLNDLNISVDDIKEVRYVFHNPFEMKSSTKLSVYAVTAEWCSINTRWSNRPAYYEKPVDTISVKNKGDYSFDITDLFLMMLSPANNEYSIRHSFFIKSDTENSEMLLLSGDSGLFSAYLEITLK